MIELQAFDEVMATFNPIIRNDLKPGVDDLIGIRAKFTALWIIEDGPYIDQWAMSLDYDLVRSKRIAGFWTPSCDLEDVELLERISVA